MATSVVMPALEMAQETGKLVSWKKKDGEQVKKGEILLEVETDKAVVEIEAQGDGFLGGITAKAQENTAAAEEEKPYHVADDGTVDWPTFSGFRRYNSVCHTCHGPDGVGSTFAPALVDSLKRLSYEQFYEIVVNGKSEVNTAVQKKMPAFGLDPNVMCYLDDIYAYLKARAEQAR